MLGKLGMLGMRRGAKAGKNDRNAASNSLCPVKNSLGGKEEALLDVLIVDAGRFPGSYCSAVQKDINRSALADKIDREMVFVSQ